MIISSVSSFSLPWLCEVTQSGLGVLWSHSCSQTLASNRSVLIYFSPVKHLVLNFILLLFCIKKASGSMEDRHSLFLLLLLLLLLVVLSLWVLAENVFVVFWNPCLPKMFSVLHNDFLEAVKNKNIIFSIVLKGCFDLCSDVGKMLVLFMRSLERFHFLSLAGIFWMYTIQSHNYIMYITYFTPLPSTSFWSDCGIWNINIK